MFICETLEASAEGWPMHRSFTLLGTVCLIALAAGACGKGGGRPDTGAGGGSTGAGGGGGSGGSNPGGAGGGTGVVGTGGGSGGGGVLAPGFGALSSS